MDIALYLGSRNLGTFLIKIYELSANLTQFFSSLPAPEIAVKYWRLAPDAKMREVILAIRADESHHRDVNHTLGDLNLKKQNPFGPGE